MNNGTPHTLADQEQAIWRTLAYVDLFDYPLTAVEIHRYLEDVQAALASSPLLAGQLICQNGFYCLPGREAVFAIRQQRQQQAQTLWAAARRLCLRSWAVVTMIRPFGIVSAPVSTALPVRPSTCWWRLLMPVVVVWWKRALMMY